MLVVDDEPEVAQVMAEFAGRAGYDAITTSRPALVRQRCTDDPGRGGARSLDAWYRRRARPPVGRPPQQARLVLVSGFNQRVLESARQLATSQGLRVPGALPQTHPPRTELTGCSTERGVCAQRGVTRGRNHLAELRRAFETTESSSTTSRRCRSRRAAVIGVEALVRWRLQIAQSFRPTCSSRSPRPPACPCD